MFANVISGFALGAALLGLTIPARAEQGRLLVCDKQHIDVGETGVRQQTHKFTLRNASQKRVEITATHKACGCVKREFSTYKLAPGETSELTLDFPIRPGEASVGDFLERLAIYVNDDNEAPALVVSVGGRLVPVAYRLRDGIHIEAPTKRGAEFTGRIELFLNKARGVEISKIETMGALPIDARVVKTEAAPNDGEEKVLVEVMGTLREGMELPGTAVLLISLNNKDMPEMSIPVTLYRKATHTVRFSPQQVAFGVLRIGAKAKRVIAVELPKKSKYALAKAEPTGEGLTVTIDENPRAKNVALLRCELDGSVAGAVQQELLVTVAVPDGPPEVYKLPISGFVKPAEKEHANKE